MTDSAGIVLVTGANGGIGRVITSSLLDAGYGVVATDRSSAFHSSEIARRPNFIGYIPCDLVHLVSEKSYLCFFVEEFRSLIGSSFVSGIVHNAACQIIEEFADLTPQDWNTTFAVNLLAPVLISRELLPFMCRPNGSIVHIGSIHSSLTKPKFVAYATSKAALAGLTQAMAVELGAYVRVNAIEPAAISTPMLDAGFVNDPQSRTHLENYHPTGSIGSPCDVASAVLFLLDSSNTFLNGCILPLTGGIHSRLHDPT